ncbi:MAG TPA: enoyl-CoA hydratase [Blastocatellia bacterium]|nr:enoyl-CoA hydratase [Blastocatellia bacterium]
MEVGVSRKDAKIGKERLKTPQVMEPESTNRIALEFEDLGDRGRIARIVVDHQARLNILNTELIQALTAAVNQTATDERLRVLILAGAGDRAFIGGADINEMGALDQSSAREFISRLHEACLSLRTLPVPVIARINGYCLGAGLEIAASCDLRVAADDSVFGMPEVRVGIPSVIEAALLPRLVGWGKAKELILTGEQISANEALVCGLVQRVVPLNHLDRAVDQWTQSILEAGPRATRLQKALIREWELLPLEQAIERGIEFFAAAYETDEPRKLMEKFLSRRRG